MINLFITVKYNAPGLDHSLNVLSLSLQKQSSSFFCLNEVKEKPLMSCLWLDLRRPQTQQQELQFSLKKPKSLQDRTKQTPTLKLNAPQSDPSSFKLVGKSNK